MVMHKTHNVIARKQSGSSMIEVLVSLLVLGIGILGINALQASSMRSNQSAYLRTQAVFNSFDIVERIHSNKTGAEAGNYNDPTPSINANCVAAAGCSASAMAAHDVAEWEANVAATMPMGAAVVCLDSSPDDGTAASPACDNLGDYYAVKIWWDDNRDGTANMQYVMTFEP